MLGLLGNAAQRLIRLATTWLLSGMLGPAGFGLYALLTTLCELGVAIGPLGSDAAISMYTARHRRDGDESRLKSMGTSSLRLAMFGVFGLVVLTAIALVVNPFEISEESRPLVVLLGLSITAGSLAGVVNSSLLGARDVLGHTWIQQIGLPALTLLGCAVAFGLEAGLIGAFAAYTLARCITLARGSARAWRHYSSILTNPDIRCQTNWHELLDYAVPQGLSRLLHRAITWADLFMLSWLSTFESVGIYRVAIAIAVLVALPQQLSNTVFGPLAAELIHMDEKIELQEALKRMTRWMAWLVSPIFMVVFLLGELFTTPFAPAYAQGVQALSVLMLGRTLQVLLAPAGACLTHGGHARVNLVAGTLALLLNIGLNWIWIPQWGLLGAAWASSTALGVWSIGRAITTHLLIAVNPLDKKAGALILLTLTCTALLGWGISGLGLGAQTAMVMPCALLLFVVGWRIIRDKVDRDVLRKLWGQWVSSA